MDKRDESDGSSQDEHVIGTRTTDPRGDSEPYPLSAPSLHPHLAALLGTVVNGHYRIESMLGMGGMGAVFKGRHIALERDVAIKVILPEAGEEALLQASSRFDQEARSVSRLDHANCIRVTDFFLTENAKFLVMEFLPGENLTRRLGRPWAPLQFVAFAKQILEGLAHAHHYAIIHRDIKPDNIFITTDRHGNEVVKIIDFGISKITRTREPRKLTRTGSIFGTPEYMSPEQAAGDDVDERTDLYALGVVFYEMLTGQRPFDSEDLNEIIRMQIVKPAPPLPDEVPLPLAQIVNKLLSKSKGDRYSSAEGVLAAFRDIDAALLIKFESMFLFQQAIRHETINSAMTISFYRRAAELGHVESMYRMGQCYAAGKGVPEDGKVAFYYTNRAADAGHTAAMHLLGLYYSEGRGVTQDSRLAFEWHSRASQNGHSRSMFAIALCHREGKGAVQDWAVAFEWCRKSAELGHLDAMYEVGRHYAGELPGTLADSNLALQQFRAAAELGHIDAQLRIGRIYATTDESVEKAFQWYRSAAEAGSSEGMFLVGQCYEKGWDGVAADLRASLLWYQKAAHAGHAKAMYCVGNFFVRGVVEDQDLRRAFTLYKESAELGFSEAMYAVAQCYREGKGVAADEDTFLRWLRRAAEGKDARSIHELAHYHQQRAHYWRGMSAEQHEKPLPWLPISVGANFVLGPALVFAVWAYGNSGEERAAALDDEDVVAEPDDEAIVRVANDLPAPEVDAANVQSSTCGNGVLEAGEACDGANLGGADCKSRGHLGGDLVCAADCARFEESGCHAQWWGDDFELGASGKLGDEWEVEGAADWFVSQTTPHAGGGCAQSGDIKHRQGTHLAVSLDFATEGSVTFWYRTSTESGIDKLQFSIDGTKMGVKKGEAKIRSGRVDWTEVSYPVTAGTHTLRWSYTKDVSYSFYEDAVWIDAVSTVGGVVVP